MPLSRLSAITIATNKVTAIAALDKSTNKWCGAIAHSKEHPYHPFLWIVSTDHNYDTEAEAIAIIEKVITDIRKDYDDNTLFEG